MHTEEGVLGGWDLRGKTFGNWEYFLFFLNFFSLYLLHFIMITAPFGSGEAPKQIKKDEMVALFFVLFFFFIKDNNVLESLSAFGY